jgi:hypothetical protein
MPYSSPALIQALGGFGTDPNAAIRQRVDAARSVIDELVGMRPLLEVRRPDMPQYQPPEPRLAGVGRSGGGGGGGRAMSAGWAKDLAGRYGLRITSGYRDPDHNRRVGGVPNSYHTRRGPSGESRAYDFVGSRAQTEAARRWAQQNGATEALIHRVHGGYHLHVAF